MFTALGTMSLGLYAQCNVTLHKKYLTRLGNGSIASHFLIWLLFRSEKFRGKEAIVKNQRQIRLEGMEIRVRSLNKPILNERIIHEFMKS